MFPLLSPSLFQQCWNQIVSKYQMKPEEYLSISSCSSFLPSLDPFLLIRLHTFMEHWGIINLCHSLSLPSPDLHSSTFSSSSSLQPLVFSSLPLPPTPSLPLSLSHSLTSPSTPSFSFSSSSSPTKCVICKSDCKKASYRCTVPFYCCDVCSKCFSEVLFDSFLNLSSLISLSLSYSISLSKTLLFKNRENMIQFSHLVTLKEPTMNNSVKVGVRVKLGCYWTVYFNMVRIGIRFYFSLSLSLSLILISPFLLFSPFFRLFDMLGQRVKKIVWRIF